MDNFNDNVRDYVIELAEQYGTERELLVMMLKGTDEDTIKRIVDANELSPRFFDDE